MSIAPFTQFKPPWIPTEVPPIRLWSPIQSDSLAINFDFDIRPTESICLLSGVFCLCTKQDAVATLYVLLLLLTYFPTVMKSMLSILKTSSRPGARLHGFGEIHT